jgi:hypothetical protein
MSFVLAFDRHIRVVSDWVLLYIRFVADRLELHDIHLVADRLELHGIRLEVGW